MSKVTLDNALQLLKANIVMTTRRVGKPTLSIKFGAPYYRYSEANLHHALNLKMVRQFSALHSTQLLMTNGLYLDAATLMRVLDEIGSDILFLSAPLVWQTEPLKLHEAFLKEFFQEEFDDPNPMKASQSRHRVSRNKIRAYVARTYDANDDPSTANEVFRTIDNAFSGFVHGSAVHILDTFDGEMFQMQMQPLDRPLEALLQQLQFYYFRALTAVAIANKALGDEKQFKRFYEFLKQNFDDSGMIRN